jgi:hypothetical protein
MFVLGSVARPADVAAMTLPPRIDTESATNLTNSSADLTARINPEGVSTSYRFEYGTTTEYGTSVPTLNATVGAIGFEASPVEQRIDGLTPNVTYHWRVVAINEAGESISPDHTFIYDTGGEGLPDNRAYEMVSPPQKNGALVGGVLFGLRPDISESGSRVIAASIQCYADALSCTGSRQRDGTPYLMSRSAGGWVTTALAPPATRFEASTSWLVSANTGMALFSMPALPNLEDDFYAREANGEFVDLGETTPPADGPQGEPGSSTIKATSDFSHVVFEAPQVGWPMAEGAEGSQPYELSESHGLTPELVAVSGGPDSSSLISKCQASLGSATGTAPPGTFSEDGKTVYFTASACSSGTGENAGVEVPSNTLYARIDEARTVKISERSPSDCATSACRNSLPQAAIFAGASSDGSKAFFRSNQQLTDQASSSGNLYEYDSDNQTGENLIDISAGDTSGEGPRVQGVMAISPDGSHVYFVAGGVLTVANARGEVPVSGANNLYVYERNGGHPKGQIAFIVQLPESDAAQEWRNNKGSPVHANVTPDGQFLVFESQGNLTSDHPLTEGAKRVFRYDAETAKITPVSVGERGFNDNGNGDPGNASIVPAYEGSGHAGAARTDPTMSNDGHYIFFESPAALTPHALGDVEIGTLGGEPVYAQNVYEWNEGRVSLISDGKDTTEYGVESAIKLLGSDASGANVFFRTADSLVSTDTDTQMDFYDARACTATDPCIGPQPPMTSPCLGEACHGIPSTTPIEPTGGSAALNHIVLSSPEFRPSSQSHKRRKRVRCRASRIRGHRRCPKTRKALSHHEKRGGR